MIDEDALDAAERTYAISPKPHRASIGAAIEAYLAAAPLPGEPVAWQWRYKHEGCLWTEWKPGKAEPLHGAFEVEERPLYTAAPDTAQSVAAEREAICEKLEVAAVLSASRHTAETLRELIAAIRARGAKP